MAIALCGRDTHRIGDIISAGQGCAGEGFLQVFVAGGCGRSLMGAALIVTLS
jgi:hypothetical protein